jgi:hypothetical protein
MGAMAMLVHRLRPLLLVLPLGLLACGRPFDVKTAPGLVELDDQKPRFDYRAIAPEGVVFGVRVVDIGEKKGDLAFWVRATTLRMHQLDGYALLGEADVKSRDGTPGHEMRFGHEQGKQYLYTLRVYVKNGRLYLVETGGPSDEFAKYHDALEWMEGSLKLD